MLKLKSILKGIGLMFCFAFMIALVSCEKEVPTVEVVEVELQAEKEEKDSTGDNKALVCEPVITLNNCTIDFSWDGPSCPDLSATTSTLNGYYAVNYAIHDENGNEVDDVLFYNLSQTPSLNCVDAGCSYSYTLTKCGNYTATAYILQNGTIIYSGSVTIDRPAVQVNNKPYYRCPCTVVGPAPGVLELP